MIDTHKVRVAAVQYQVGTDVEANLSTSLRMIDQASAECQPDLIVLPEFCNHLSWYQDKQHCYDVSVSLDGDFLSAIAAKAKQLSCHIVVNCTVQREGQNGVQSATGSSLLYSSEGKLLADNTKQIYIGHENDFLERAEKAGPVVETGLGRIGLYACMDGVINETPRSLSLRGAQILCNSLNSFATDEGSLHIPVRAAENRVFVVAANKTGPLVPEELVEGISQATGIPVRFLSGAGDSQIVSPDGTVLVKAGSSDEEVVFADINPAEADLKERPDGTNVFVSRRPELYEPIVTDPSRQQEPEWLGAEELSTVVVRLKSSGESALQEAIEKLKTIDTEAPGLIALPPLVTATMIAGAEDLSKAEAFSVKAVDAIAKNCNSHFVSTAIVSRNEKDEFQYTMVLIDENGVCLQQGQIHWSHRTGWSKCSDQIETLDLPFGRVGLVCTDDSIYPETFRLMAMAGVEVACVALDPLQEWELQTGLLERSAENRINLLVAATETEYGSSFTTCLQRDFTVMTEWQERSFDGLLSQPVWQQMPEGESLLKTILHPAGAANKEVSANTNLLSNRPWDLAGALVS